MAVLESVMAVLLPVAAEAKEAAEAEKEAILRGRCTWPKNRPLRDIP